MRRLAVRLLIPPLALLALAGLARPAFADNVAQQLGANGATTVNLTGSAPGTTTIAYWIDNNNAGGNQFSACDAADGSAATVSIETPAGLTASPSTLVFTACGSATSNTKPVTFSASTPGSYPVTASVTDARGRYSTTNAAFTITVVRPNTPPAVAVSGIQAGGVYEAGAVPAAFCNVTDVEDGAKTFAATLGSITGPLAGYGLGGQTASCAYTDGGGATATASAAFSIVDSTAPTLTVPGDIAKEAAGASGATATWQASAVDAVDPAPVVTCTPQSGGSFPLGSTAVSCTAADAAGNVANGQFLVVVQDTAAPLLTLPGDVTVEATGPAGAATQYAASASDTVDGPLTPTCVPASGSTFALGRTPVNCTATDAAGNASSGGFNVTVVDTTAPALTLPGDATVEATGQAGASVSFSASAADLVSGDLAVTCDSPSGSTFALGTTTVSCTAVDAAGNLVSGSFTVTVRDTTAPALTLPADLTQEASKPEGADIAYAASASDLVDGTVAVTCSPANGTFGLGTTTVNCSATDARGNTAAGSFTVAVVDTTAPVFADVPASQVVEATGPYGAVVGFTAPTASDAVGGERTVECSAASGAMFGLGTTNVTCAASDASGNTAQVGFAVTVVDTTAPEVSVPDNQTVEATGPAGAAADWTAPSATDTVDGAVMVNCDRTSGAVMPLGVTTVTCEATDAAGNTGSAAFTVSVQDSTAPVVTAPDSRTVEATGPDGAAAGWAAPTAMDTVDGERSVICDRQSGGTFPLGATTVTCSASDTRGNTGYAAFVVTVADTTAPVLALPTDRTVEATGPDGAAVTYLATASDLVSGPVAVSCTAGPGTVFGLGETQVTCSASDAAGNTATRHFTVTIVDTTAPAVTVPASRTVEATGPLGVDVTYSASAADLVDGAPVPTCTPASGGMFPLGATLVTCTATDTRGNAGSATFTVTVIDTTAPLLELPGGLTAFAGSAAGARVTYRALAADAVSGTLVPTCTPASGSVFAPGQTTVRCTAVDQAGNSRTGTFTVTVAFEFGGFLAPVDRNAVNVIKAGSTVPIKWKVSNQAGGYIGDLGIVSRTASGVVACGGGIADDLALYATGGTSLRYDTTASQYIFNWQSPKAPGTCMQVVIGFTDGRTYSATFQLK